MFTALPPTNSVPLYDTTHPHLARSIVLPIDRCTQTRHREHTDRNPKRGPHLGAATNVAVEVSPSQSVKRRIATWPGVAAEIVQTTRHDRIESRFCAPVHLLAAYECGVRHNGATFVEGLPVSTLRDLRRKLILVPAGHEYHDWQEPRILGRVSYFFFDPDGLTPELGFADMSFAPRMFFENSALWDTALKLATLIESTGLEHRLYAEALGIVLAYEVVRFNSGQPRVEPRVRGGLAAWQQRIVVAYIEDHLAEPISLAALAALVRLSPYHFCRAFKQSFRTPPHRYHVDRRIERAKTLLATSQPSVTDIGFAVGFSQTSSFTSAFRKATGSTPSSYRRSLC